MAEPVGATRSELLARRARIRLATRGLLEQKRDQLMVAFREAAALASSTGEALAQAARNARRALTRAEVEDGPEAVRSAALSTRAEIPVDVRAVTVMGVRVAEIEDVTIRHPLTRRGYGLPGTSARIDAAASAFEDELEQLLALATVELRLRRLADEIGRTTRRVNALERVVLPRLEGQARRIASTLDEREREDGFRRRRLAARKRRRRAGRLERRGRG